MFTKGFVQLASNETYFYDRWFSGVKNSDKAMALGVDYCRPVKSTHEGFCLATLEKLIKDWPGGSYIVMMINPRVHGGRPFMAIGYK